MDPVSVIVLALVYAALRAPGEAGRAVRSDYRDRRGRWSARAEPWMTRGAGRGRGGRRVAGYDRNARPYSRRDYRGRGGGGRGPAGWWRDPQAWRGPEGRARIARGVRPSAIRTGIVAGALAYTALFGAAVAARGFGRGLHGGYRLGKAHYRAKRNGATGPTITVAPADPGTLPDDAEIVDAEIVPDPDAGAGARATPGTAADPADADVDAPLAMAIALEPPSPDGMPRDADMRSGPWLLIVHGPGVNRWTGGDAEGVAIYDADELDRRLGLIASIPGLRAEVKALPDPFDDSVQPEPRDSRPDPAGPTATREHEGEPMPLSSARDVEQALTDSQPDPPVPVVARYVPVAGAPVGASMLMEGANYDAHLHNLGFLLGQAQREYAAAELTLASAAATRKRAENDIAAAERMAAALSAQDFGQEHVAHMVALQELLAAQVAAARAAHEAAFESTLANEHVIEVCSAAEAAFRRDHQQLAEAHATAPHAAKTREAYQD
jgi:hypothetical protein